MAKDTPKKKREFGVVLEDGVVAQVQETLDEVKVDVGAIKTTLEQVNLVDLKQELIDLKKRVEELESRVVK